MTLADQGIQALREKYPTAFLMRCVNNGPWTIYDLSVEGRIEQFAIWNHTGNVYRVEESGAVEDDPFIEVTPL